MRRVIGLFVCSIMVLAFTGCSELYWDSVVNKDKVWNEEFKEEIEDLADQNKSNQDPNRMDPQFFARNKPRLKTAQIMLDSGKLITKIKDYFKSIATEIVADSKELPPEKRLVGTWYGVDRGYDDALVFTFDENGRYYRKSRGHVKQGTYLVEPEGTPLHIRFRPEPGAEMVSAAFQFLDDKTLLFEAADRSVVLVRQ